MANIQTQFLPKLINNDKVVFVPARHSGANTRWTIDLIALIERLPGLLWFLSLDAQMAFDRLSWPYMFVTLSHYGHKCPFLNVLTTLYSFPTAQVKLSLFLSSNFSTRQGCPLPLLLFILYLEPLAEAIKLHTDIHGVLMQHHRWHFYWP